MDIKTLYSIGHSNDSFEKFVKRLKIHHIQAIADVRSQPYSRYASWFNRENISISLKKNDIAYVFLGDKVGARCTDPYCIVDGQVDFTKVAQRKEFQSGIARIRHGLSKFNIALMCSEKDPMTCHRTILIAREFVKYNIDIQHIFPDNNIQYHSKLMQRIAYENNYHNDLFMSEEDKVNQSYKLQAGKMGYIA